MPAQISNQNFILKYLFKVLYIDGSHFEQTSDDVSSIDPKRSQFYDVLQSGKKIRSFGIFGADHALIVDLRDGHFELDGVSIHPEILPPGPAPLDLIFFRQHEQDMSISYEVDNDRNPVETGREAGEHRCKYFVGWQCSLNGKGYKQVLGLS